MTIQELREARNKTWEGAKAFVESKRDKDGLLSAEDAATYAEMEKKGQAGVPAYSDARILMQKISLYVFMSQFTG